ncbi:MAG: RnfABCDGE type electron transport complex subunit D [Candidatus Hydrogenedentes bacterium]|nr:RnfABCDGE type electron transport complex subunit D [Candidatus Hydrogenedentota bacterium]
MPVEHPACPVLQNRQSRQPQEEGKRVSAESRTIELRSSPHIRAGLSTDAIMLNVVYALVPVCLFAVAAFGLSAALMLAVAAGSCLLTERLMCRMGRQPSTLGDYSALVTGLLLGLTLPPGFPLWMTALGGFVSIALGKALFGGLGHNVFNPALVGRAFLQAAFPAAITEWTPAFITGRLTTCIPSTLAFPFMKAPSIDAYVANAGIDGWSGATPLMIMKFRFGSEAFDAITTQGLFLGSVAGSLGETCALLILIGGAYLIARRMMDWRIPVGMLGGAFALSSVFYLMDTSRYPTPFFMLFSGGLMLGAVFMATDMVTSPTTTAGTWVYSIVIGLFTVIIRLKGGLPEGVMYAILLGNALTPLINNVTQPRIYGAKRETKAEG